MNIKNRLRHIAQASALGRRFGKTTAIVKSAKELDGMILAADHKQAKQLERQFNVPARSFEINLDGFNGPFFLDHYALETLLNKAANKIEQLEEANEKLKAAYDILLDRHQNEIENLEHEIRELYILGDI